MPFLKRGYVQLYTGNGKGKTTAALGLAIRAAGSGLKVYIAQFAKGIETGELRVLRKLGRAVTVRQFGSHSFVKSLPSESDRLLARRGLAAAEKAVRGGRYDIVILDELSFVCYRRLVPAETVLNLLKARPEHVEIVITGRDAPKKLVAAADLVTEMKEIKHYFRHGVKARRGIEY